LILILNRCMNLRLISYKTNKMTKGSFMYAEKIEYDDIEMSSRLRNILGRNGFESLEGLREYPKEHFIKFRNMGQATLQELYQICEEQGIKLRSVEDLNDREHGVRFDDFLCMDAFRMGIKSKDDLRRYSLEELEKMCPKDKRLFVRLKKLLLYTGSSFSLWKVTKIIFLFHQNYFSRKKFCGYRFRLHVLLLKLSTVSINSLLRRVEFIDFCGWFLHASFLSDHFFRVIHMKK